MNEKKDKKTNAILRALKDEQSPINSLKIMETLAASGMDMSERSIRMYLGEMDREGLTSSCGRKGRIITEKGIASLHSTEISQRSGRLSAKIDQMTYRMNFTLANSSGKLVVNTSIVDPTAFEEKIDKICKVFSKGYAMGDRACILNPGETINGQKIPKNKIGFCTVCSVTINGVMLKHGIPTASRFGGLLEIKNGKPKQFLEMIDYDGTTIDPLEIFIRSGMTDYTGAIKNGNGKVGAGFREYPADSREVVLQIARQLSSIGLGAFAQIGLPGQPVLGIPVSAGRFGAIVIGGLNPIAILEENGYRVESRALSGLLEYTRLYPSRFLPTHLAEIQEIPDSINSN